MGDITPGCPASASSTLILSFKATIVIIEQPDGQMALRTPLRDMPLTQTRPGLLAALDLLSSDGATEEELVELVSRHDGNWALSTLYYYLERFNQLGLLCHTLTWNGHKLATLTPISPLYHFAPIKVNRGDRYVLSRFAYLHQDNQQFILETPLGYARVILHHWLATTLLHLLAQPHTVDELHHQFHTLISPPVGGPGGLLPPDAPLSASPDTISLFLSLLLGCQALSAHQPEGALANEDEFLAQWDFHDLLFHTRSRLGRHNKPYGENPRFLDKIAPLPAIKAPMSDEIIRLYQPNIQQLEASDPPFTRVLEARQSIRRHGDQPLKLAQLGEFLYRAARVRVLIQADAETPYERSDRPYPGGGACYEIELYLTINACQGLAFGLYHYCPKQHLLYKLASQKSQVEALLDDAALSAGQAQRPQVLIILAARFQRVAWKYTSLAYALILKDVGALYQTMYLAATAMKLAACALGGGNSDLFAAAIGANYYAETSVGEFILGSRPDKDE